MEFLKKPMFKKIFPPVLILIIAAGLLGGSYYIGYVKGTDNPKKILVEGIANIDNEDLKADFAIFWEAWQVLKENHLKGAEITDKEYVYSAISGLASAFKDPNTTFLRADTGADKLFKEDIAGAFGGAGMEIGLKDQRLIVISPLKKSPAERAGLRGGDVILKIDDFKTDGITVNEAVKRIRGQVGTAVVLNIAREDWVSSKDIKIIREEIVVPTLDLEMVNDGEFAHLSLHSFNEKAPVRFYEEVIKVLLHKPKGIILDLRNNPGGFLEVAINIASWFLPEGSVVAEEQFRDKSQNRKFTARGNPALKDMPMVILVNQGSASASEILAGALRDHRGIKLIGEKTFGKGTVQELRTLHAGETMEGGELKITVANWVLPGGEIIDEKGLKPDVEVKLTEEDVKNKKDPQLEKAIQILKAGLSK